MIGFSDLTGQGGKDSILYDIITYYCDSVRISQYVNYYIGMQ